MTLNQAQIENEAVGGEQHYGGNLPNLPPDDTADLSNWSFRTDAYAQDAWVGGPAFYDAEGTSLDPSAYERDAITEASVTVQEAGLSLPSPRVFGVVGRNYVGSTGQEFTSHGGGILMVYMIQHANSLFPE